MELSGLKIENFLMFSRKKVFLYFRKWNFLALRTKNFRREPSWLEKYKKPTLKKFLYFRK